MAKRNADIWHDHYEILGLDDEDLGPKATLAQIERGWKSQRAIWHPDSFAGRSQEDKKKAGERFKLVNESYEVLSDPRRKAQFDREWQTYREAEPEAREAPSNNEEQKVMRPEIVIEWEPAEAANPDYFYDLEPGDKKEASLWVRPKFPGMEAFRVRVTGPLPQWLSVTPTSFEPPARLSIEVDATGINVHPGGDWRSGFDLGFVLDE